MAEPFLDPQAEGTGRIWAVGPLMRAVSDTLAARFNPIAVRGEISGLSRAASGHCYFSLKDETGQVRCAMFRRAAEQTRFALSNGLQVEAHGKLDVYGARGELQLIVERLKPAGQGALFEQYLRLKAQLEAEGLFDAARKRELPAHVRNIGVVTSLGAAALRDVATALRRRVPHLPVVIYPASVQGAQAPEEICAALQIAYERHARHGESDVLLLVRGGGSLEDLWSFNDEAVVRMIARAPMPVICGVGHETDFTLSDFVADLRAPTPTAAAELCAPAQELRLGELRYLQERLSESVQDLIDRRAQRLDLLTQRLGQPSARLYANRRRLETVQHRLHTGLSLTVQRSQNTLTNVAAALPLALARSLERQHLKLQRSETALGMLDPSLVLQRGYAFLTDSQGAAIMRVSQTQPGQGLTATLADGSIGLRVED